MLFQKKQTGYQGYGQPDNSGKKKMLIIIVSFTLLLMLVFGLLSRSNSSKNSPANTLTPTTLSAFSSEQISISYPKDFKLTNEDGQFVFTLEKPETDNPQQPVLTVYPYAQDLKDLDSLAETSTKNTSGEVLGTAKKVNINGKDSLWVTSKPDSEGKLLQRLFVVGDTYTWLVKAEYYNKKDSLGKNVDSIFNSFKLTNKTQ